MAITVLSEFNVFSAVPLDATSDNAPTTAEIAAKTKLPEHIVKRLLRHVMALRIFTETSPGSGRIVHTAASAAVAREGQVGKAFIGHHLDEVGRGCVQVVDAIRKYGDGDGEPSRSGMSLALWPDAPLDGTFFDFMEKDGVDDGGVEAAEGGWENKSKGFRMRRFGAVMSAVSKEPGFAMSHIHPAFDWKSLGDATLVDVSVFFFSNLQVSSCVQDAC